MVSGQMAAATRAAVLIATRSAPCRPTSWGACSKTSSPTPTSAPWSHAPVNYLGVREWKNDEELASLLSFAACSQACRARRAVGRALAGAGGAPRADVRAGPVDASCGARGKVGWIRGACTPHGTKSRRRLVVIGAWRSVDGTRAWSSGAVI